MGINSFYAANISPFLRKTEIGKRIDMAFIAFHANLQFARFMYAESGGRIFSDREIEELFAGLDEESLNIAKRFMSRQYKALPNSLMVHPKYFYTEAEYAEYQKLRKDFNASIRRFHLPHHQVGPESLYYHHGLRFAPEFVKTHIAGKLFGDIGGYLGDSTLVFLEYDPEKILIFEPDETFLGKLTQTLNRNHIPKEKYDIHSVGLADVDTFSNGMKCCTMDEISSNYATPFGVLKADIEGMGAAFVRGARKTIERDRPLLSLAIYHNEEEFTEIHRMLKSWGVDYHVEIKSLNPFVAHGEVTLLAYPQEWIC